MTGVLLTALFLAWILPVQGALVTMTVNCRTEDFGSRWLSHPTGIATCWLIGIYLLTLTCAVGSVNGDPLSMFTNAFLISGIAIPPIMFAKLIPAWRQVTWSRPRWYEWLVALFLIEKVIVAIWQLNVIPVYFEDPLFHWVTRGREFYSGVNWSWDSRSEVFLGPTEWNRHYPLCLPVLRALLAQYNGEFTDIIARIDGFVFFAIITTILWSTCYRVTSSRPISALAVFAWQTQPLLPWHIAGGNADLALSAFLIAAVASLLERRFFLAGLLVAGAAWCKNDGVVLVNISVLAGIIMKLSDQPQITHNATLTRLTSTYLPALARYLAGFLTLLPWLLFRQYHQLALSPNQEAPGLHLDAIPAITWDLFKSPTTGLFWLATLGVSLAIVPTLFRNADSRCIGAVTATYLTLIALIFTLTDAYRWLQNDVTLFRLLLQLSPVAALLLAAALSQITPLDQSRTRQEAHPASNA